MAKLILTDIENLENQNTAKANINANNTATETALENTLSRDGTNPNQMNANLDMNSFRILNVPNPVSAGDAVNFQTISTLNGGGTVSNLPTSGTTGQVLSKLSNTDFDTVWVTRQLVAPVAGITVTDPTGLTGSTTLVLANDLAAVEGLSGTGFTVRTGTDTWTNRLISGAAAGINVANGDGVATNPSIVLANDLAGLEGISGTGFAVRTATDTWTTRLISGAAAGVTVSNGDGVATNPAIALANDLAALEGLSSTGIAARTATDTWAQRTITGTANEITLSNGSGVSGNPTISLPSALTFAGKTVTGGSFSGVALTTSSYNGNAWTAGTGTLTLGAGKTATISNTLTFTGTDGSTLNVGAGGTLGSNAYTSTAYASYLEGSWTPTVTTDGTVGSPTYSVQIGSYERIGRQVTARFTITLTSWPGATGNVSLSGLPLTSANTANDYGGCMLGLYNVAGLSAGNVMGAVVPPNGTIITLVQNGTTIASNVTVAQFGPTATVIGMCQYHV